AGCICERQSGLSRAGDRGAATRRPPDAGLPSDRARGCIDPRAVPRTGTPGGTPMSSDDVLTPDAIEFLHLLQREAGGAREEILGARAARAKRLRDGELTDFLEETQSVREGDWRVQ